MVKKANAIEVVSNVDGKPTTEADKADQKAAFLLEKISENNEFCWSELRASCATIFGEEPGRDNVNGKQK